jgi:CheY-like chemotaxis protein
MRACPGATLHAASDATMGIEFARQHAPALVLLDPHLPDGPGTWVLGQLAARPEPPAVFVPRADATATRAAAPRRATGAQLTKPIDVPALMHALGEQFAGRVR